MDDTFIREHIEGNIRTVEAHIKEPKFFLGSLNRFLIKWLLF